MMVHQKVSASAASARVPHEDAIVFVVDDDISVRESLEMLIRHAGWTSKMFACAQEFLAHPRQNMPRCLVLDVTLPDLNGLDLQRSLSIDQPYMPIIFITGYGDIPTSVQAMKAGAFEFLTKPLFSDVLLASIRGALERSRKALREEAELDVLRDCYASLTPREREVMELVTSGYLNKEIGDELGISVITVKAHRGSVMRKMDAESLAELVGINARLRAAMQPKDESFALHT